MQEPALLDAVRSHCLSHPSGQDTERVKKILDRHGFVRIMAAVLVPYEDHSHLYPGCGERRGIMRCGRANGQYRNAQIAGSGNQSCRDLRIDGTDGRRGARAEMETDAASLLDAAD